MSSYKAFSLPAALDSVRPATETLLDAATAWGVPAASGGLFAVALGEVIINAVKHGGRPGAEIRCEIELTDAALLLRVFDAGPGFDLACLRTPAPEREHPEHLAETGYGLAIVQAVFARVEPIRRHGMFGVELTMPLDAPAPAGPPV